MVPLSLNHVVFQEGDVVPHHLDECLVERGESGGATSAMDQSTFLAALGSLGLPCGDTRPLITIAGCQRAPGEVRPT